MRDQLRELFYSDKIFDNPVLGKVSCASFTQTLKACKEYNHQVKNSDPCLELRHATAQCYTAKNTEAVNNYLMGQFEESLMLIKFLESRGSQIPSKMEANTWAVFTNPQNLKIYEKERKKLDRGPEKRFSE